VILDNSSLKNCEENFILYNTFMGRGGNQPSQTKPTFTGAAGSRGKSDLPPFTASIDFKLFPKKGAPETEEGFTIAKVTNEQTGERNTLKGKFGPVIEGEMIQVTKYAVRHDRKFGEYIQVWAISHQDPVTRGAVIGYLQNLPGIGDKLSAEIVDQLGTDCLEKIDKDPDLLMKIKLPSGYGLKEKDLQEISKEWDKLRAARKNMIYFSSLGVNDSTAQKIVKHFKELKINDLPKVIEKDPYLVCLAPGVGFKVADMIAQRMGVPADDPRRNAAGVEYLLKLAENDGHVCLKHEDIFKHLGSILRRNGQTPSQQDIEKGIEQLLKQGRIWIEKNPTDGIERIYTSEHFLMETRLYQFLEKRLTTPPSEAPPLIKSPDSQVTDEQWQAVHHAFEQKLSILTGAAGCGKCVVADTSVLINNKKVAISECWDKFSGEIVFDGQGYWKKLDTPLQTVSMNTETNQLVVGKVTKLYKQYVRETGDHVILESGQQITMTKRHRLMTDQGWKATIDLNDQVIVADPEAVSPLLDFNNSFNKKLVVSSNDSEFTATTTENKSNLLLKKQKMIQQTKKSKAVLSEDVQLDCWVYDLEVEGHHNYLANNIVSHNTTALLEVLDQIDNHNKTYTCLAPTGKAAKRMQQATSREASTIHRQLGREVFKPVGQGDVQIKTDFVIIDEASMLDMRLAEKLMTCTSEDTRIVLVGDPNQLPAVGAGSVLHDLIDSDRVATTKLTKIFRQAEDSMLVVNANRIRQGKEPYWSKEEAEKALGHSVRDDWQFIESQDPNFVMNKTIELCQKMEKELSIDNDQIMVTAPAKKGTVGVHSLNQRLQDQYNPNGLEIRSGEQRLRLNDRVMNTQNRYGSDPVMNGEQGIITRYEKEKKLAWVKFEDIKEELPFAGDEIQNLIPAFAATTHKLQGSEAPVVICPLVGDTSDRLLSRNMLYTAQTRGKEKCIVIGDKKKVIQAVAKDGAIRETTLDLRIDQVMPRIKARWEQLEEYKKMEQEDEQHNKMFKQDNFFYDAII
jgi:ATP-dependent exoDNAse (exonuclease V) alpha subunit